jgi:hypothetical protein
MSVAMTFGDAFIQGPHNATFATATTSAQSGFLGRLLLKHDGYFLVAL